MEQLRQLDTDGLDHVESLAGLTCLAASSLDRNYRPTASHHCLFMFTHLVDYSRVTGSGDDTASHFHFRSRSMGALRWRYLHGAYDTLHSDKGMSQPSMNLHLLCRSELDG